MRPQTHALEKITFNWQQSTLFKIAKSSNNGEKNPLEIKNSTESQNHQRTEWTLIKFITLINYYLGIQI